MKKKLGPTITDLVKMADESGLTASIALVPKRLKPIPHTRDVAIKAVERIMKDGRCSANGRDVQILVDIVQYFIEESKHSQ